MTAADMDPGAVLEPMNRFVTLPAEVVFGFINEDEGL